MKFANGLVVNEANVLHQLARLWEMLIEQIIKVEWRGPGPPGRTCTPITAYVSDKTKICKKNLCRTSPYLGQITYKI